MSTVNDPNGQYAAVDDNHRLQTAAKSSSLQHIVSEESQQAYQVSGSCALTIGSSIAIHAKNTSTSKNMIVTFIRAQVIDITGFAEAATYVTLNSGQTVASGGITVTPPNMYIGHSNAAEVTATSGASAITQGGTKVEFDRWYPEKDADKEKWNKDGALIVPPQQSIDVMITSGTAAGTLYARMSFIMEAPDT